MPSLPRSTKEGPGVPQDQQKRLHLYTQSTPNGKKVQIMLEELKELYGLEWSTELMLIDTNYQKEDWYLAICPNGRIPALVDNEKKFATFETAAIILYLVKEFDKNDTLGFKDEFERNECLQWIFFTHGGTGPMQGQLNHFAKSAPEKLPYAIERYKKETLRLYSVYEDRLSGRITGKPRKYLAGHGEGKYSMADINAFGWTNSWPDNQQISKEDMKAFPHLTDWLERIRARPAVQRGINNYNRD